MPKVIKMKQHTKEKYVRSLFTMRNIFSPRHYNPMPEETSIKAKDAIDRYDEWVATFDYHVHERIIDM